MKDLKDVADHLERKGTKDAKTAAAICKRVLAERAELVSAVSRLSRRLDRCVAELADAAKKLGGA